jgi:hypothetical protein
MATYVNNILLLRHMVIQISKFSRADLGVLEKRLISGPASIQAPDLSARSLVTILTALSKPLLKIP